MSDDEENEAKAGGATTAKSSDDHRAAPAEELLALLREIRDLQRETLALQKSHIWILLPIFALLAISLILALSDFI